MDSIALARHCLKLICDIAARGARSSDPAIMGYALQELTQVLLERTGTQNRIFEPMPVQQIEGLTNLSSELDFVHGCIEDMMHREPRNPLHAAAPDIWN